MLSTFPDITYLPLVHHIHLHNEPVRFICKQNVYIVKINIKFKILITQDVFITLTRCRYTYCTRRGCVDLKKKITMEVNFQVP